LSFYEGVGDLKIEESESEVLCTDFTALPKTDLEDCTDECSAFCLRFQDCEVKRVRKEEEEKYKKKLLGRESQMQADIHRQEEELTQKLKDAEDRLARQQQSLECDLQMKQKQVQEQHLQVAHKLQQVEVSD
jgi:hypothetical protein